MTLCTMKEILGETEQESCDSFVTESGDDSLYLPTPERKVRESIKNVCLVPKVCFPGLEPVGQFHEAIKSKLDTIIQRFSLTNNIPQ